MILKTIKQKDYELLDSGDGKKLERYGSYLLSRPDPEALWKKSLIEEAWGKSDLEFIRSGTKNKWIIKNGVPNNWDISYGNLKFNIKPTSFKHIGLFPEQLSNWKWMTELIRSGERPCLKGAQGKDLKSEPVSVLNLFAYTGGATLACAKAGALVAHVDASKNAVEWARLNAEISGLKDAPIRWLIEDVVLFLKREIKRGTKYDGIIMDPPAFGRGAKGEVWKIEEDFLPLIDDLIQLLTPEPLFFLMSGYASGYSAIAFENNLGIFKEKFGGNIEVGELTLREKSGRLLPAGIFGKWWNE